MSESLYRSAAPEDGGATATGKSAGTIYRVIFEGIKRDIETSDSFAIKYGILTSTPVTKIKFMLRNLPKTVLETKNGPKARGTLELIQEAGGIGTIEEINPEEKLKVEISEEDPAIVAIREKSCLKCGFPLKDSDKYCQFCHSPLVETGSRKVKTIMKAGGAGHLITPKRLVITVVVLLIVLIWACLMR